MRTRINQIRKLKNKDRGKTQKTKSTILTLSFPEGASCAIISPQGRGVGTLETGPRWRPARPLVGVREQALGGALEARTLGEQALERQALEEQALERQAPEEQALERQALEERALERRALEGAAEERALEGAAVESQVEAGL